MRLGLFMMPVHPPGRVLAETLAEDDEGYRLTDLAVRTGLSTISRTPTAAAR